MVVHVFPAAKLTGVLLRQISRPIANSVKDYAKSHPYFRKYFCMPPAYLYNWCEVKVKMWAFRTGKPVKIPPLNDAMAIELGASILGEVVIFLTAAIVISFEYIRQSRKEERKEQLRREELEKLHVKIQSLRNVVTQQEEQIVELFNTVRKLEKKPVTDLRSSSVSSSPRGQLRSRKLSIRNLLPFQTLNSEPTSPPMNQSDENNSNTTSQTSITDYSNVSVPMSSENNSFMVELIRGNIEANSKLGDLFSTLMYVLKGIFLGQRENKNDTDAEMQNEIDTNSPDSEV